MSALSRPDLPGLASERGAGRLAGAIGFRGRCPCGQSGRESAPWNGGAETQNALGQWARAERVIAVRRRGALGEVRGGERLRQQKRDAPQHDARFLRQPAGDWTAACVRRLRRDAAGVRWWRGQCVFLMPLRVFLPAIRPASRSRSFVIFGGPAVQFPLDE
jgi:hypothetical protein